MDSKTKKPIATVTGSHNKTIIFGVISSEGKQQLFRQYVRFDSHSFITSLEEVRKKFKKFVIFVDKAPPQHRSMIVKKYLKRNGDNLRIEYLPVGSPQFN